MGVSSAIGQGVPRFEDPRLVRGEGTLCGATSTLPGMAFGHVLRSPHAHGAHSRHRCEPGQGSRPGVLAVLNRRGIGRHPDSAICRFRVA